MAEREIDEKTGFRRDPTAEEFQAALKSAKRAGPNTHRATERGYAIVEGQGILVEAEEMVPAGAVIGSWMEPIKKGDQRVMDAVEDAQRETKDDPDYTALSKPALEALATDAGVTNVKGLSKDDLITAIKASADRSRTI